MSDRQLRVSINPCLVDKNEAGGTDLFVSGWENVDLTQDELVTKITDGVAYTAQLPEGRAVATPAHQKR